MTLALDEDVATFFRSMGRGHQGRMNDVLRAFMLSVKEGYLPMVGFEGGGETGAVVKQANAGAAK